MISVPRYLIFAAMVVAHLLGAGDHAMGQVKTNAKKSPPIIMKVDWKSPEIQKFIRERATNPPQSLGPDDEAKLSKLKLPVLAFDRPPGIVARAFGVARMPARKRQLVTDPDNPNWYTIIDTFGDVTISVDGDLRIQQQLPADTKIYTPPPGLSTEPDVNVIDRKVEEGMEGLIAEYIVHKFPDIPYRITIECSPQNKQHCADVKSILRDRTSLRIISARPER